MDARTPARDVRSAWKWPALLGVGSVFALVAALVADGSLGWDVVCWALLLAPVAVVVRALWSGRATRS